ncbi:cytochrome P450 family protein [Hyphomonas neptunium ATCC 15444]|uniref:Cytochrome P450 family protein n=2 Tax=Hyphomonas TaxID=85 RepID=Q0C4P5_HYPNA|nr:MULTISPECIES: cytochrome P450 [Hyphomonas]ABI77391.1 cytochrome P450 family protein [Hyphomonas neptunium ATCC 15444]KCZ96489.1 cytochrome P450 family protein [Hyphomonas hirschiana VP5]
MAIPEHIAREVIDPKAYADGKRVDDAFTWLRANAPLDVATVEGFDPFWVVTRHADILNIERQNDLFHNEDRSATLTTIESDKRVREMMGGSPNILRSLVQMDNPDHMQYRRLTQAWFMPQNLRKLEDRVREIARGFIDQMAAKGTECDFARDVAFLYPLHVIMEVLGVPPIDEPRMLKLTQELFGTQDPDVNRAGKEVGTTDDALKMINETIFDFMTYFNAMTEDRRQNPREDLASVIANGAVYGQPLGHLEAMSYYIIAATAGHDTTSNTTAGAMWALAENPDQFRKVKDDLSLIPSMVEESIRWETPVKHFMRTATDDTEVAGQKIAKNDWLFLAYPSGNRDEAVFDDPFTFKVDRSPNKHVAFGYGAHVCIGQHLARMEMRVLWEELLPRLHSIEMAGKPQRTQANFVSGPKSVPIRFKMS